MTEKNDRDTAPGTESCLGTTTVFLKSNSGSHPFNPDHTLQLTETAPLDLPLSMEVGGTGARNRDLWYQLYDITFL